MVDIYDYETATYLTQGLQGCDVCDEAIQAAKSIAAELDKDVVLEDDDGYWLVHPDGSCEEIGEGWAE